MTSTVVRMATWNVNSFRARVDRVVSWLERSAIDVAALQETKVRDDPFPYDAFKQLGDEVAHIGTLAVERLGDRVPGRAGGRPAVLTQCFVAQAVLPVNRLKSSRR